MLNSSRDIVGAPPPDPGPRHVDFGLVIGIDHYSGAPALRGAVADAAGFHAWLCDADGGGLTAEHAKLVESRRTPIAPLQDEVDRTLCTIEATARAAGGGRRLYFYFSGHGAGSPASDDVALLLAKWSRSLSRFALSSDEYRGELRRTGLFEEIVFSLDCCRTTAERAIGSPPTVAFQALREPAATRTFIAYATEDGRPAFEAPDRELWQGVFTRCLLASLRSSPYGITAADLKIELEHAITLHGQRPHIVNGLLPGSKFGRKGPSPNLVIVFKHAHGRVCLLDGWHRLVDQCDRFTEPGAVCSPEAGTWELSVRPGLYKLEDSAGHTWVFDHGREAVTRVVF